MFSKVAFIVSAIVLAVSATDSKCNTGPVQCCNSVQSADSSDVVDVLALMGVVVKDATTMVGMTCSPITAMSGMSGNGCSSQPVCCENNNFNGIIAVGCSPMNVNV